MSAFLEAQPLLRLLHGTTLALLLGALRISEAGAQQRPVWDTDAAGLLDAVRSRLAMQDVSLGSFQTTVHERTSVALRSPVREHLVYRREMAARLNWSRTAAPRIRMLGAREYRAIPGSRVRVLDDVGSEALDLVFTPGSQLRTIGLGAFHLGDHPLSPAAEGRYRFALGDTVILQLPDGRAVRLIEVRVDPVQAVFPAVQGSMWIDEASHTVVREVYSPLVDPNVDAATLPFIGEVSLGIERVVVEHGLWELRWWLPRVLTFEGTVRVGRLAGATLRYERSYSGYDAQAVSGELAQPTMPAADRRRWLVELPSDPASLLHSEELPPSIFSMDTPAMVALRALRDAPWPATPPRRRQAHRSDLQLATLDLLRYNRVEGVSIGGRIGIRRGWGAAEFTTRSATARWMPQLEMLLTLERSGASMSLAAFHRIEPLDLEGSALSAVASLNALLFAHDDADYYRATGASVELVQRGPATTVRVWLVAQREAALEAMADWTLPRLLGRQHELRPNVRARSATLVGPAISLETGGGHGGGARWRARFGTNAAGGTYTFARSTILLSAATRDQAPVAAAAALVAGAASGDVPPQHEWQLGGAASLRGYPGATLSGTRLAFARFDISAGSPATRVHLFLDAGSTDRSARPGQTGTREDAGIALGLLDGTLRLDLAYALQAPHGTRVSFSGVGIF
ncbi:MAG TPA: hypothetical protein VK933_11500 [Longimicrobiales bacterium]|nr:hypothetical protein [Longimicrobiales bacterium]